MYNKVIGAYKGGKQDYRHVMQAECPIGTEGINLSNLLSLFYSLVFSSLDHLLIYCFRRQYLFRGNFSNKYALIMKNSSILSFNLCYYHFYLLQELNQVLLKYLPG